MTDDSPLWKHALVVLVGFVVLLVVAWLLGACTKSSTRGHCVKRCVSCPCVMLDAGASAETPPGSAAR